MASSSSSAVVERILKRANPSTIQDKFLVGYQGWFTCAGDGEPIARGHHGWLHWFNQPIPHGGRPNVDLWPDVSSYSPSELYPAPGLKKKSGEQVFLFSSRNAKSVQRHFHWMAEHGVDGAFLQRFAGQCDMEAGNEGVRRLRDEVGDRVKEAAEREGRVFAIMYDVSGVPPNRIQHVLEQDWLHLVRNKGILDSPSYLKEKGKPVVALWGFGFDNAGHTPALVCSIVQFFRSVTPGGVYLMAGTPAHWRTADGDADQNPEFTNVWLNEFDAISPWTIGRYKSESEADAFAETKIKGDVDLIELHNEEGRSRKVDYIPVVFPGGSGHNLSEGKWGFNDIPRKGGRFLWQQVFNARRNGARIIYGAMWDEYDEGTAFMPAVANKQGLPESDRWPFLALDDGGYDLPSDWYMRICGFIGEVLRGERRIFESFPSKELQDYWGTRPRYENVPLKSAEFISGYGAAGSSSAGGSGSGSGEDRSGQGGQSYEEWLAAQKAQEEEAPPPPYSLEAEEEPTPAPAQAVLLNAAATPAVSPTAAATIPSAPTSTPNGMSAPGQPHRGDYTATANPPTINAQTHPSSYAYAAPAANAAPIAAPAQDPMATLTDDFGRTGLSSSPTSSSSLAYLSGPTSSSPPRTSYVPPGPSPPVHHAHPAAQSQYGRPPGGRPHAPSNTLPPPQSRPGSMSRPPSSSAAAGAAAAAVPPPVPASSSTGTWSQAQWPPADWQLPTTGSSAVPAAPAAAIANIASSAGPAPAAAAVHGQNQAGGASLSRPHTFTASQGYGGPSSLHYSATVGHPARPGSSRPPVSSSGPSTPQASGFPGGAGAEGASSYQPSSAMPNTNAGPASGYGGRPTAQQPASAYGGPSSSSRPPYGPSSSSSPSSPSSSSFGYASPSGMPSGPSSGYPMSGPPPTSSYPPSTGGPGFPGAYAPPQASGSGSMSFPSGNNGGSAYPSYRPPSAAPSFPHSGHTPKQSYGPSSTYPCDNNEYPSWSGGPLAPLQASPPMSPTVAGMGGFPGSAPNAAYPSAYPSGYPEAYPNPNAYPEAYPNTSNAYPDAYSDAYAPHGGPPFPGSSSGGGDGGYFGGAPGGAPSQFPSYGSNFGYGYGGGGAPTPTPWMPGGPTSSSQGGPLPPPPTHPPALPPRPSNSSSYGNTSSSSSKPSSAFGFPMASGAGSTAFGYALSAVDKVAGRKTREQLESQVGSIAQTGSKLFNKFTK